MSKTILAVPSVQPGGLDAGMGMHFGHRAVFQLHDGVLPGDLGHGLGCVLESEGRV